MGRTFGVIGFVALLGAGSAWAAETAELRVLGTSDVHGAILGYDYFRGAPADGVGLSRVATAVAAIRKEHPEAILADNGDLVQGNPLCDFFAKERLGSGTNPVINAMNIMGYDVGGLGNHEFNFGLDTLRTFMGQARYPVVNANVFLDDHDKNPKNDKLLFKPFAIVERKLAGHPLKVGFVSVAPEGIMQWDGSHLSGKVIAKPFVESLKGAARLARSAGADVVVALAHTGFDDVPDAKKDEDILALAVASLPEVDGMVFGHSHLEFPGQKFPAAGKPGVDAVQGTVRGKPAVIPGTQGNNLGVLTFRLEWDAGWKVKGGRGELVSTKGLAEDEKIVAGTRAAHEAVLQYLERPIGTAKGALVSFAARFSDAAATELVAQAQRWYVEKALRGTPEGKLPLLSAAAPFRVGVKGASDFTEVAAGSLTLRHASDLYLYPNTLVAVKLTGRQVRDWLETSAKNFNTIDPSKKEDQELINPDFAGYNFDAIEGVSYRIDVTRPEGGRIVDLTFEGKPISETAQFIVATNNYRAYGGGHFPALDGKTVVRGFPDEVRQVVSEFIRTRKTVEPRADGNWSIKPLSSQAGRVLVSTHPKAQEIVSGWISRTGESSDNGLVRFSVDLTKVVP